MPASAEPGSTRRSSLDALGIAASVSGSILLAAPTGTSLGSSAVGQQSRQRLFQRHDAPKQPLLQGEEALTTTSTKTLPYG